MRIPLLAAAIMLPMATAVLACGEKKACSYEENFSTDVLRDGSWTLVLDGEVPDGDRRKEWMAEDVSSSLLRNEHR